MKLMGEISIEIASHNATPSRLCFKAIVLPFLLCHLPNLLKCLSTNCYQTSLADSLVSISVIRQQNPF